MSFKLINPESLGAPHGYSNGVLAEPEGRLLFVAGQIGWNRKQELVSDDFVEQFDKALANVVAVVQEAGGRPEHIVRMTIYITDRSEYLGRVQQVGERYRSHLSKHFPAMSLVVVKELLEEGAKVEIEATAII